MRKTTLPIPGSRTVNAVAWDPKGARIAAVCADGSVWVWNVATQAVIFSHTFKGTCLLTVAWSPDGKSMAVGGTDNTIAILQASNGRVLLSHSFRKPIRKVAWSLLGTQFLVVSGEEVRILTEGRESAFILQHGSQVLDAAWRLDGTSIGTICTNGLIQICDTLSKRQLYQIEQVNQPCSIAWDPSGQFLAIGTRWGNVQLHDAYDGTFLRAAHLAQTEIGSLDWNTPCLVAALPTAPHVALWDGSSTGEVKTVDDLVELGARRKRNMEDTCASVACSPNGERLAAGKRGAVWIASLGEHMP